MKIEVRRTGLVIIPETAQDDAYIEDTLGLTTKGTVIGIVRMETSDVARVDPHLSASKIILATRSDPPKVFTGVRVSHDTNVSTLLDSVG